MKIKILYLLLLVLLCGCATLHISRDLNEDVSADKDVIVDENTLFIFYKSNRRVGRNEVEMVPFSRETYIDEIEAVSELRIFKHAIFDGTGNKDKNIHRVEIGITRTYFSEGCYMGGCMLWPSMQKITYDIEVKVYRANSNDTIFTSHDSIVGELRKTSLDFSLGPRPLRRVDEKAPALLIKHSLAKFQNSDAFKELFLKNRSKN